MNEKQYEVRQQTFDAMHQNTPIIDLPVVFRGTLDQCGEYCKQQEGYTLKPSRRHIFGGYFYNKQQCCTLFIT